MRIRNAFKIAVANFALVFKNLLYKAIIFVLFALVAGLILNIGLKPVLNSLSNVLVEVKTAVVNAYNGVPTPFAPLKASIEELLVYISSYDGSVFFTAVILIVVAYVFGYFSGVGDSVLVLLINGYMTSLSRPSYIGTLMENLKKILVYQLIYALLALGADIITYIFTALIAYLTFLISPILSVFFTVLSLVALCSLSRAVLSQVTTTALCEEGKLGALILKGFRSEKEYLLKMFTEYLVLTVAILYFTLSVGVFTLGVGVLIVLPFSSVLLASVKEVDYFTINRRKYFVHFDSIFVPKELRENDEKLLNDIEI